MCVFYVKLVLLLLLLSNSVFTINEKLVNIIVHSVHLITVALNVLLDLYSMKINIHDIRIFKQ